MIGWIIFFLVSLAVLAYYLFNKDQFEVEWTTFKRKDKTYNLPLIYTIMHKSQFGINFCKRFNEKHPKLLGWTKWWMIIGGGIVGILTVITIIWGLNQSIIDTLSKKVIEISTVALVLPIDIKSSAVYYVPFGYWIVAVFVTMLIHEFGHAIVCTKLGIPIKNTGLAALAILIPIVPAAYVKPDEDAIKAQTTSNQLWVYSAGSIMNILLGIIFLPIVLILGVVGLFSGLPVAFPLTTGPMWWVILFNITEFIFVFNVGIGMMNLFPMMPLDGEHIMRLLYQKQKLKDWTWKATSIAALLLLIACFTVPAMLKSFMG